MYSRGAVAIEWDFAVVEWLRYVCAQALGLHEVAKQAFEEAISFFPEISVA